MTAEQPYGNEKALSHQIHEKVSPSFGQKVPMGSRVWTQQRTPGDLRDGEFIGAGTASGDDSGYYLPTDDEPDPYSDYGSLDNSDE